MQTQLKFNNIRNSMEKFVAKYKQHYEIINYIIVATLLAISCFVKNFCFVPLIFAVLLTPFYNLTQNLKMLFFIFPFQILYIDCKVNPFYIFLYSILVVTLIKYIIEVCKKTKKINKKLLIVLVVMFAYLFMPMHTINIGRILTFLMIYLAIYLAYEYRKVIDFEKIITIFALSFFISCGFYLLKFVSPYLNAIVPIVKTGNHLRFQALFWHPGNMATNGIIILTALAALLYVEKINIKKFLVLFCPIYILNILTLARDYIVAFAVLMIVFLTLYLIKFKKSGLKNVGIIVLSLAICSLCLFYQFKVMLERYAEGIAMPALPTDKETLDKIYSGEIHYDPGRLGIWKLYLTDWSSSITTILFGRGVARARIGEMSSHNVAIHYLWANGIFGYALLLCLACVLVNFKKINKQCVLLSLFLLPIAASFMLDTLYETQKIILTLICISAFTLPNLKEEK